MSERTDRVLKAVDELESSLSSFPELPEQAKTPVIALLDSLRPLMASIVMIESATITMTPEPAPTITPVPDPVITTATAETPPPPEGGDGA